MLDEKQIDPLIYRRLLQLEEKYDALLHAWNQRLNLEVVVKQHGDYIQSLSPELGKLQNNFRTLERIVSDLLDAHVERENRKTPADSHASLDAAERAGVRGYPVEDKRSVESGLGLGHSNAFSQSLDNSHAALQSLTDCESDDEPVTDRSPNIR